MKKPTLRMLSLLVLTVVVASASAIPVAEVAGGDIYSDVNRKIVGIWIEVENGNSGWVWMAENHTYMTEWNYDTQGNDGKSMLV